jgi:hypothetical protein
MRCGLSVPMVSAITELWRVMTLMDLCLPDGVKLRYPTLWGKCITSAV